MCSSDLNAIRREENLPSKNEGGRPMEPSGLWLASQGVLTAYGRAADVESPVWFPDYADVEKTARRFPG